MPGQKIFKVVIVLQNKSVHVFWGIIKKNKARDAMPKSRDDIKIYKVALSLHLVTLAAF